MSTKRNYSGQDQRGRVRGPWNAPENYRMNACKARFAYDGGSEYPTDDYPFVQGEDYELHIFSHDAPIWWDASFTAIDAEGGASTIVGLGANILTSHIGLNTSELGTYTVANADCYDSVSLVTATNSVAITKGWRGFFTVPDGSLAGQSLSIIGETKFLGLGANAQGPMRFGAGQAGGAGRSYLSVILLESEYTQAMRDAGDIFITDTTFIVQVCGIFAPVGGGLEP